MQAAAAVLIADKADFVTTADGGDFDLVLLHLIADPASANQRNDQYNTFALHNIRARMHSQYLFCSQRSDCRIYSGETPLHWSSKRGHLVVCQCLVEKGADVNATDNMYETRPNAYADENALSLIFFVCILLILDFSVEAPRCIGLLFQVPWSFASFS